ncbi:MAG: gephyrin-like molybdotransferase Glp [Myxococcota bacterium]
MLTLDEARTRLAQDARALPPELLGTDAALGRYLAEDVLAREDAPPFDNAAMDGWALRATDVAGASKGTPARLRRAGFESRAGGGLPPALAPGEAMRIYTGAALPAGADAIVVQEEAEVRGDHVALAFAAGPDHHIRRQASDLAAGATLLGAGTRLGPGALALLASQGHTLVRVHRAPRVAVLVTGDELHDVGAPRPPGTLYDSNGPLLQALLREAGALPSRLPRVGDDADAMTAALAGGLATADLVVTTGGASVGRHDHVRGALARLGVELLVPKVRVKPGKPFAFGRRDAVAVAVLPGNPVSAFVTFQLFVRPWLRRSLGDPRPERPRLRAQLAHDHRHSPGRPELARGRLEADGAGGWLVHLAARQGSGSLGSLADDALALLPEGQTDLPAGTSVEAIWLHPTTSG